MSGGALALALGAAFLHAAWNVLLAGSRDSVAMTGAMLVLGAVLLAPAALLFGEVSSEAVPFIAASTVLQVAYFALLARAYRSGELGVVYPVARGSAPVVVLGAGVLGLGDGVSAAAAVGVFLVAAGVLLVGYPARAAGGRRDLGFGLAIGTVIAGYTLVDSEGLDHADPLPYLFFVTAAASVPYCAALVAGGKGAELKAALTPRTALTAAAAFGGYAMVLAALQMAPAAPVAAVREASIVIAAVFAWLLLEEERRLAGAALVAAGVALIAYS